MGAKIPGARSFASPQAKESVNTGMNVLRSLAECLGVAPSKLIAGLIADAQGYDTLDPDGIDCGFEKTDGTLGPNEFVFAAATAIPIRFKVAAVGYFVPQIEMHVDGIDAKDIESVLLKISGHQRRVETKPIGAGHYVIEYNRIVSQSHIFEITPSNAAADARVSVKMTAAGLFPDDKVVEAVMAERYEALAEHEKGGGLKLRGQFAKDSAKVASGALAKGAEQLVGGHVEKALGRMGVNAGFGGGGGGGGRQSGGLGGTLRTMQGATRKLF